MLTVMRTNFNIKRRTKFIGGAFANEMSKQEGLFSQFTEEEFDYINNKYNLELGMSRTIEDLEEIINHFKLEKLLKGKR